LAMLYQGQTTSLSQPTGGNLKNNLTRISSRNLVCSPLPTSKMNEQLWPLRDTKWVHLSLLMYHLSSYDREYRKLLNDAIESWPGNAQTGPVVWVGLVTLANLP
jgi:hypothetical protein